MGGMLMATQSPKAAVSCAVIFWVLDALAVTLRFASRRRKKQRLLADDWLTIPALLLNAGLAAVIIHGVAVHVYGYPTPMPETPQNMARSLLFPRTTWTDVNENITISQRNEWIFFVLSIPALGFTKLSILCFYQRIFVVSKRDYKDPMTLAIWSMIAIVSMWTIAFCLRYLFACGIHFDIWWTYYERVATECGDFNAIMWALTISDFVCDVIILLLPLPTIWGLQMAFSHKLAVTFTFMLGSFATIASMIRMIWALWVSGQHFNPNLDLDLLMTTFLFWNYLEATVGLLAACLPTLKSLISASSLDSMVNSVRSMLSLQSLGSLRGSTGRSRTEITHDPNLLHSESARPSESSRSEMLNLHTRSETSAKAIPRLDEVELNEEVLKNGIRVERGWGAEVTGKK